MHVCLLVAVDPPPLGDPDLEAGTQRLEGIVELAGSRPHAPFAVHVAPHLLAHVAGERPDLASALGGTAIEWVRSGWGRPLLTVLTDQLLAAALRLEEDVLGRAGLAPGPLWIRDAWCDRLVPVVAEAGVSALLVDSRLGMSARGGIVAHLDRVLPALRVERGVGSLDATDECLVTLVEPGDLTESIDRVSATGGCDLTTPSRFLESHRVAGRLSLPPGPRVWSDPDVDLLVRRLVRTATRLPARATPETTRHVLSAAHAPALAPGAAGPLRRSAHSALIRARSALDHQRRRGTDWGRVSRVDWDADGIEEVEVDQPELSLVLDPERGARLLTLDDKLDAWPALLVPHAPPASLAVLEPVDGAPTDVDLEVERTGEARGDVTVDLSGSTGGGGRLTVSIVVSARTVRLTYVLEGGPEGRLGVRLPLALGAARLRVDGSEWRQVDRRFEVTGHRVRLQGGSRQVLASSMVPLHLTAEPAQGGVVVSAHWSTGGHGLYDLRLDLS